MPFYIDYVPPTEPWLTVIHEAPHFIVVDKQSGILSVPGREDKTRDCLQSRLEADYGEIHVVHRLDLPTSGVIVYARDLETHKALSAQWRERTVDKRYVAVVDGVMADDVGEIDLPLTSDWPNRPKQKICHETGKPALTRFQVLERGANQTRVSLEPLTGRTHQLRMHLMALGHTMLGDPLYAEPDVLNRAERLLLHAEHLAFDDPKTGERMGYERAAEF